MSTATASLSRREMLFGRSCAETKPAQPDLSYRASAVVARMSGIAGPARVSSRIPDCQVVSHRDERFRFISDLVADRRVMMGFIYTHCEGICPTTTKHMFEAYKLLKERSTEPFVMLSITIDRSATRLTPCCATPSATAWPTSTTGTSSPRPRPTPPPSCGRYARAMPRPGTISR